MENIKSIITNKFFLIFISFMLTALALKLIGEIGWIFMLYPVIYLITGIIYGAILNPIREYKQNKRYLSYKGVLKGTVSCMGNPIPMTKVVIHNPKDQFDIDASNYYTFTDVNGRFEIPHVKEGILDCVAYHNGYDIFNQSFTIIGDRIFEIDIELKAKI